MIAELRFDNVAYLPGLKRERCLLEFRGRLPLGYKTELAALLFARVLRSLFRESREISAALKLSQDILSLGFVVHQYMRYVYLLGFLELLLIRIIVFFRVFVGNLDRILYLFLQVSLY